MPSRSAIAIGITRRRLCAVLGSLRPGALAVDRVLAADVPPALDLEDPHAVGTWLGEQIRSAGFPRARATMALSREQLGFKRMTLPSTDAAELPQMTRLAMLRELPFDASSAVIDFLPVERSETGTTVIAVAVPRSVLEFNQRVLKAAGLACERISLRNMGASTLVDSLGPEPGCGVLVIDVAGDTVEFTVVEDGAVRFSRAAEFTDGSEPGSPCEAVITETRRTWMSYRIVEDSENVRRAVLIGDPEVTEDAAGAVGEMLRVPTEVLGDHPLVEDGGRVLGARWALAGLLLESAIGRPSINFAAPRRPPDVGARRRQVALAAVGVLLVVAVGAALHASSRLKSLRGELVTLTDRAREAQPARYRHKRDVLKIEHLRQWETARADWLGHLARLAALAPPRADLVFDGWTGSLEFRGVKYEKDGKKWSAPMRVKITLEGEARDRSTADAYREALVRSDLYTTSSAGADAIGRGRTLPFPFSYSLVSDRGAPMPSAGSPPAQPDPRVERVAQEGGS